MTERSTKTILTIALFALMAFQLLAAYPGYLSFDSAYQWWQARGGEITSLWPPGSVYLLRLFDAIWVGPHGVFVLQILGYWCCVVAFTRLVHVRALAWVSAIVLALLPVMWVCAPHVWSDVQLAIALFAAVVMLFACERAVSSPVRIGLLAVSLALLTFASILRHNAIVAIAPLALAWCVVALRVRSVRSSVAKVAIATTAVVVAIFGIYVANVNLASKVRADTYAITLIWDLQALSVATNRNLIPSEISPDTNLEDLRTNFSPLHAVQLYAGSRATWANSATGLSDIQKRVLQRTWFDAVVAYPSEYLWHRARVMFRMLGLKSDAARHGGSDERGRLQFKDNPNYGLANPGVLMYWQRWSDLLKSMWIATPIVWLTVSSILFFIAAFARRRRSSFASDEAEVSSPVLPACVWASGALYIASFFATTPAADLRYVLWSTIACVLAALLALEKRRN